MDNLFDKHFGKTLIVCAVVLVLCAAFGYYQIYKDFQSGAANTMTLYLAYYNPCVHESFIKVME